MTTLGPGDVDTFLLNHGQVKQLEYILTHSTQADDTKCTNSCTITTFPHANKILLRIIQKQLQSYIGYETPMEQAGLRKRCAAREQTASVGESWRVQGNTTKASNSFIDYTKDFDSVQHLNM